jgi:hypothetical protein
MIDQKIEDPGGRASRRIHPMLHEFKQFKQDLLFIWYRLSLGHATNKEACMLTKEKTHWLPAIVTGQVAGLIMAVVVMLVLTLFLGKTPLYPVQVIGSLVFGAEALQGFHAGAFLAGLVLHQLGPSLLWGCVFAFLMTKLWTGHPQQVLYLSLLMGVISMAGPYFLIPLVMKSLHGVDYWNQEVPILWDWAAHFVFGLSFLLYGKFEGKTQ